MDGWRWMRAVAVGAAFSMAGGALAQPGMDKPAPAGEEEKKPEAEKPKGPALKVGDKAPVLSIEKWAKGEAVTGFEKGRVYVVEFWATWCPPCLESIPHLTELAKKHKKDGLTIIGISDETADKVGPFVEKMGDKMDYVVAVDKKNGGDAVTSTAWMKAAEQDGIPTAFIVDKDGKVAWIGHPMDGLDKVVGQVIAGTFDAKKHAEAQEKKRKFYGELREAAMGQDWDKALKLLDEMATWDADSAKQAGMMKFQMLLMGKKDYAAAYAQATKLAEGPFKDDAEALNSIAWTILDDDSVEKRDFDVALKIAQRAVDASKGENGMILDTLARAWYEKKDLDKAIEIQKKAVEKGAGKGGNEEVLDSMKETLKKYEAEKAKGGEKK